jgi:hypothetical protein
VADGFLSLGGLEHSELEPDEGCRFGMRLQENTSDWPRWT